MPDTQKLPKQIVYTVIPSMNESRYGLDVKAFQVVNADNKSKGFESIIGQSTPIGSYISIHIPDGHMFAVILVFCEKSKRALIYVVDRNSVIYFYKENHEFAPDTVWADNTMYMIRTLLEKSQSLAPDIEL